MLLADDLRIQDAGGRVQRIDRRIDTKLGQLASLSFADLREAVNQGIATGFVHIAAEIQPGTMPEFLEPR